MAEEVISTASIVYKYHQRYGNAKDKTRKGNMHKYKTKKNKQLQQQNNNNKKETKKNLSCAYECSKRRFSLESRYRPKDVCGCSKSIWTRRNFKNNFRTLSNSTCKKKHANRLFNTDSFRTSVYEKNTESKNREKKILFCLKPLFLLKCSFGDV